MSEHPLRRRTDRGFWGHVQATLREEVWRGLYLVVIVVVAGFVYWSDTTKDERQIRGQVIACQRNNKDRRAINAAHRQLKHFLEIFAQRARARGDTSTAAEFDAFRADVKIVVIPDCERRVRRDIRRGHG